jgi:ABC-2 type transport system ATP-binding protein
MAENGIIIKAVNLTKKFGNFVANDNLNFEVRQGEIFGFLGANGAGKTTAIRILCGLLKPTSGQIKVAGYDVYKQTDKIKRNIGYMSQKFSLYEDLTVRENFRFYGGIYGLSGKEIREKTGYFLDKLQLTAIRDKIISSLPLGWKQKLAFSIANIHDPKIIFLDEPTSGVDPITRRQFWDMIYETAHEGITIFVTTHYMDEAEYCGRVSVMVDGKIAAMDTPLALEDKYHVETMEEVFLKIARG